MTADRQDGHEQRGTGYHLVLDADLVERLGATGLGEYAARIVDVARQAPTLTGEQTQDLLAEATRDAELPEPQRAALAGALRSVGATGLAISTADGQVLYNPELAERSHQAPDVRGTEDPENPDRPVYS